MMTIGTPPGESDNADDALGADALADPAPVRLPAARASLGASLDRFAGAFTALSGLLVAAPDAAALHRVRDEGLLADWPWQEDQACRSGVDLLRQSALARESEKEIRRDYNRLFFGPESMVAPPYESVHRSEEHLVFEQETMQVRVAYARFGLAAPRLNTEPDDHIGLELGFLGALCVGAMDAIDSGDDAELCRLLDGVQSFLEVHLLTWGPQCLTLAANGAQTLFYRGVAALGLHALDHAQEAFCPRPRDGHLD